MKTYKLHYYGDAGHGWYRISKKFLLKHIPEVWNEISCCSYTNLRSVYLEEDQDVGIVIKALNEQGFKLLPIKSTYAKSYSTIRKLKRFNCYSTA